MYCPSSFSLGLLIYLIVLCCFENIDCMETIVWPSFKDNVLLICVRKCTGNIALNLLLAIRVNFIPEVNTDCFF